MTRHSRITILAPLVIATVVGCSRSAPPSPAPSAPVVPQAREGPPPTRSELLRGEYGRLRANNDLLYYHLDVRVDPDKKYLSGKNTIRFKMLEVATRIQLDLHAALNVDKILLGETILNYERDSGAVFVDFPETLRAGRTYTIDFHYSGNPV